MTETITKTVDDLVKLPVFTDVLEVLSGHFCELIDYNLTGDEYVRGLVFSPLSKYKRIQADSRTTVSLENFSQHCRLHASKLSNG